MNRKRLALMLLLSLTLVLGACGAAGNSATSASPSASASSASASTAAESSSAAATPKADPVELTVAFLVTGNVPADQAKVEEELSKITLEKVNATVKLLPINFGAAMQQYNLMLASGEKLDLMMTFPFTYSSLVSQNHLQDIGGLVDQYGQGIKDALGKFYFNGLIGGKIYGVNPITEGAGGAGICFRKDILDKYGIDPKSMETGLDGIEAALKTIKEKEPTAFPLGYSNQSQGIAEAYFMLTGVDRLTDSFGALMNYAQELKVVNMYETQEYKDFVYRMRDWYTKGYIMESIATAKEDQHSLMKAGKTYAYFTPTKPGIAQQESAQNGYECVVPQFGKPFAFTSTLFLWVVPNACEHPDVAVKMLNEMYTNADLENLLSWGIKDVHYVDKGDGTIGFPDGIDDKTSGYFINTPWMMGNELLTHVWQGNSPDLWKQTKEFRESAVFSKAMGFTYDSANIKNEITELNNVYNQYKMALEAGVVDPEKTLPEFLDKLKKAGIDKVVAEKQAQLDKWAAENNIK